MSDSQSNDILVLESEYNIAIVELKRQTDYVSSLKKQIDILKGDKSQILCNECRIRKSDICDELIYKKYIIQPYS